MGAFLADMWSLAVVSAGYATFLSREGGAACSRQSDKERIEVLTQCDFVLSDLSVSVMSLSQAGVSGGSDSLKAAECPVMTRVSGLTRCPLPDKPKWSAGEREGERGGRESDKEREG